MSDEKTETWDLWYPKAGATGIPFARGRIAAGVYSLLVHAAPETMTATIYDEQGQSLATGKDLPMSAESPISRLTRKGDRVEREDIWPQDSDIGQLVILPGGEVGTLCKWWHADDYSAWRWQIEFYNRRG